MPKCEDVFAQALNSLRAKFVIDFDELNKYRYSGHGVIAGKGKMAGKMWIIFYHILQKEKELRGRDI